MELIGVDVNCNFMTTCPLLAGLKLYPSGKQNRNLPKICPLPTTRIFLLAGKETTHKKAMKSGIQRYICSQFTSINNILERKLQSSKKVRSQKVENNQTEYSKLKDQEKFYEIHQKINSRINSVSQKYFHQGPTLFKNVLPQFTTVQNHCLSQRAN